MLGEEFERKRRVPESKRFSFGILESVIVGLWIGIALALLWIAKGWL